MVNPDQSKSEMRRSSACAASSSNGRVARGEQAASEGLNADAIERAVERGRRNLGEILKRPEMKSAEEMGQLMGISRQAVDDQHKAGKLLAIAGGGRSKRFPDWQVGEGGRPLDGLREIIGILGPDWPSFRFLTQRDDDGEPLYRKLTEEDAAMLISKAHGEASGDFS